MIKRNRILSDIHPKDLLYGSDCLVMEFDNKYDVLEFIKKHKATGNSIKHTETFFANIKNYKANENKVEEIRNNVMNNLIKRGIITGTIYEGYKYTLNGEVIDYAQLATGNPNCMMTPIKKYDKWFYELYINMSIPGRIKEEDIEEGAIRLIETIRALEELNIEIKINIVDYSKNLYFTNDDTYEDLLVIIPLLSHAEFKDYIKLMPFILGSFLRGPLFTIAKNSITDREAISSDMGEAIKLKNTVNLWDLDEVELARGILVDLGI